MARWAIPVNSAAIATARRSRPASTSPGILSPAASETSPYERVASIASMASKETSEAGARSAPSPSKVTTTSAVGRSQNIVDIGAVRRRASPFAKPPKEPVASPLASFGSHSARCSSDPAAEITSAAPAVPSRGLGAQA